MWHCLLGRGQRRNTEAHLLISSPLFKELSSETGSFSCHSNRCSPQPTLSLSFPLSQSHPHGRCPAAVSLSTILLVWLFCLTVSLILWLLESHAQNCTIHFLTSYLINYCTVLLKHRLRNAFTGLDQLGRADALWTTEPCWTMLIA